MQDARDEATRILNRANADKQAVIDSIRKLEDDREDVRDEYADILKDFIADASRKLADLGAFAGAGAVAAAGAYAVAQPAAELIEGETTGAFDHADYVEEPVVEYTTPQATDAVIAAATPVASAYEGPLRLRRRRRLRVRGDRLIPEAKRLLPVQRSPAGFDARDAREACEGLLRMGSARVARRRALAVSTALASVVSPCSLHLAGLERARRALGGAMSSGKSEKGE